MNKTLFRLVSALALLPLASPAATVCKTYEEAAKDIKDDGIILFVYGPDWDRTSTAFVNKLINDPAVQAAAGDAKLILAPFYQRPDEKQKAEQAAAFGALKLPDPMSAETYPALHFHNDKGHVYAYLRGPELVRATPAEVAESIRVRVENHRKQLELIKQAEQTKGLERAKLYGETTRLPFVERPLGIQQYILGYDGNDELGYVRSMKFYPEGFAEEKKDLSLADGLALVEQKLSEPGYTPVQKQQFCAMAIGYLHRNKGSDADIIKWAQRMKALDPDSYLGQSADIVVSHWANQPYTYQRGAYHNATNPAPTKTDEGKKGKKGKKNGKD